MNQRFITAINYLVNRHEIKNQAHLARLLNKDSSTLSLYIKGKRSIPYDTIDDFCSMFPIVNKVWLTTGEGEMLKSGTTTINNGIISHNNGNGTTNNTINNTKEDPLNRGEVAVLTQDIAKATDVNIMELVRNGDLEMRDPLPNLPPYTLCYRNGSNCMFPYIFPGDQLALQLLDSDTPIFGGEVYAMDYRNTGLIIRRVYEEEEGSLRLVPFNKEYTEVKIKKRDVFSFFRIVGILRTIVSGANQ